MTRTSEGKVSARARGANSEPVKIRHDELKKAIESSMKRRGMEMDYSAFRKRKK